MKIKLNLKNSTYCNGVKTNALFLDRYVFIQYYPKQAVNILGALGQCGKYSDDFNIGIVPLGILVKGKHFGHRAHA